MGIGDGAVGGYDDSMICRRTPLGRYGRVEEVASMVTYLASEEASFITGITYNVDGGWTAYGGW